MSEKERVRGGGERERERARFLVSSVERPEEVLAFWLNAAK